MSKEARDMLLSLAAGLIIGQLFSIRGQLAELNENYRLVHAKEIAAAKAVEATK